jgi:hypothetical protein
MNPEKKGLNPERTIEENARELIRNNTRIIELCTESINRNLEMQQLTREEMEILNSSADKQGERVQQRLAFLTTELTERLPNDLAFDQKCINDAKREIDFMKDLLAKIQSQKPPESSMIN